MEQGTKPRLIFWAMSHAAGYVRSLLPISLRERDGSTASFNMSGCMEYPQ